MSLIELPRRKREARMFIEAPPGFQKRVNRALKALGELPEDLELPGLEDLAGALIEIADAIEGDADLEPEADDEIVTVDDLPLFAAAARR